MPCVRRYPAPYQTTSGAGEHFNLFLMSCIISVVVPRTVVLPLWLLRSRAACGAWSYEGSKSVILRSRIIHTSQPNGKHPKIGTRTRQRLTSQSPICSSLLHGSAHINRSLHWHGVQIIRMKEKRMLLALANTGSNISAIIARDVSKKTHADSCIIPLYWTSRVPDNCSKSS